MTRHAAALRTRIACVVLRVIEFDVERFVKARREIFQRRIARLRVCVADQTHRYGRGRELSAVTVSAGFVARETRRR